ncbi:D-alanyl-D-alanine dipeptidase [Pseudomonadota bacterium]
MSLVEITEATHNLELDLKYATSENFTGQPVYRRAACYLHVEAEKCLMIARDLAERQGWGLQIFDAFRPSESQWKLWNHTPDPDFLADPRRGSPHSRGVAVDLTLIDKASGEALDMGTGFDAFTPLSHHGNPGISAEAEHNRLLLMGLMTTAGWDFFRNEWWHYQLFDSRDFPVFGDGDLSEPMTAP